MTTSHTSASAATRATFDVGGDRLVHRLGYGTVQLTGPGAWGEPGDRREAVRVLRRAVELGVDLIDTADSYGPEVAEELVAEALHPYPDELVIATKAGLARTGPARWHPLGRPEYLRQQCEMSLRRLRLDRIDLFQLHRIDPTVPLADQVGTLRDLQVEGKIRHIGLSEVDMSQIEAARKLAPIATVQNLYNLVDRQAERVLHYCEREGLGFIPWFPLATGILPRDRGRLAAIAGELGATPAQVALGWLLQHSPVLLPIPGTSSPAHLEENLRAAEMTIRPEQIAVLDHLA